MGCGARILSPGRAAPLGSLWDVWSARATPLPAPSPCTACSGMDFPNVLRALEEFSAHKQLSQALLMDCTAHKAHPRAIIAWLELLL